MQKKANAKVKPIASANSNISEKDLLKLVKQYVNDKVTDIVGCIKYRNDLDTLVNKLNKNNKFFSVNATDNTDGTTTVSVRFTDVVKAKTKKFKRNESTNDIVVEPIVEVNQPTENEVVINEVAPENDMNTTIETENTNEVIADEVSTPNQPTKNDMIVDDDSNELIDDIDVRDPDEIADEVIDEENEENEDDDFEEEDDRRFDDETDEDKVDYRREYYEDDDMLADFAHCFTYAVCSQ
jgi:hypothetical protein